MISESQERMVAVVEPDRLAEVEAACARWELPCTVIGEVTGTRRAARLPRRRARRRDPRGAADRGVPALRGRAARRAGAGAARRAAVTFEPKSWVFEQYDQLVGSRTVRRPGPRRGGAAPRRHARPRRLAATGRRSASATLPRRLEAMMDAARNVACAGGEPIAPHRLPQLRQPGAAGDRAGARAAIDGIAHAAERARDPGRLRQRLALQRDRRRPIPPTPVVGCVGLVDDVRRVPGGWRRGDRGAPRGVARRLARGRGGARPLRVARRRTRFSLCPRRRQTADVTPRSPRPLPGARRRSRCRDPGRLRLAPRRGVILASRPSGSSRSARAASVELGDVADVRRVRRSARPAATSRGSPTSACYALQHRGQESAGIAVSEGGRLTGAARPRPRRAGLRRAEALRPARRARDRPHALLDDRLERRGRTRSRSSTTAARAPSRSVTTATSSTPARCAKSCAPTASARDDLRQRGDRGDDRDDERRSTKPPRRRCARLDGAATVVGLADGKLVRVPRRARLPAARARQARRRPGRRLRDVRARPRRRRASMREVEPGELVIADADGSRRSRCSPRASAGALCIFEYFYLARPDTRARGSRGARRARAHGRAARRRVARRRRPRAPDPRLGHPRPRSASPARSGSRSARG